MAQKQGIAALLKETYSKWSDHEAPRLGASVAFYSILSFAPMIVLITAIIGLVFGHESAQGALVNEARQVMGDRGADTVQTLLKNAQKPASGTFASIIAIITLLFGASGVFTELQDALNLMWDAKAKSASGFMGMIKQRLFSFGMVLSVGFLLLISLLLSAGLAFAGHAFGQVVPMPMPVLEAINFVVSFAVVTALFALMFKYVPDAKVSWKDVWIGAFGTALLFTVGKLLLGLYLGKAGVGSTYGAAGSLVAVVVWIYYSAQIFFFGAEFTHLYSERQGTAVPEAKAQAALAATPAATPAQEMAMAAAAGSGKPVAVSSPPSPVVSIDKPAAVPAAAAKSPTPDIPTRPEPGRSALPVRVAQPVVAGALQRRPKPVQTKPRLLMSLAVGFLLGRITQQIRSARASKPAVSGKD